MSTIVTRTGTDRPQTSRYRLPGIAREGIAQLSLLETALWPLQGGVRETATFDTSYSYVVSREKRSAHVSVYAPLGLQSIDEYVLWGLLGMSLSRRQPTPTLLATPYWLIKNLGLPIGGFQYDQLRASIERLAAVAYQNTAFYNPLTQEHERVTLHFFSAYLPTRGRGVSVDSDRAWKIEWSPTFYRMCQATGGTLLFDLDMYRDLSPAARRLFLKLKDRFWRTKRVFLNIDDLTINGLGFSAARPLKKRKFDLTACMHELLSHQIIELGQGMTDPKQLFLKRGKGLYVVQFFEGPYFRQPLGERSRSATAELTSDPLFAPLKALGIDDSAIRRLFTQHSRGVLQRWITITEMAVHDRPRGFPGFKNSPAAFLIDAVSHNRLPPDWVYEHEREQRRQQWEHERAADAAKEAELRAQYDAERSAALSNYLKSPESLRLIAEYLPHFREFYRILEPHSFETTAIQAASKKVERENFSFPDFGVWLLERRATQS